MVFYFVKILPKTTPSSITFSVRGSPSSIIDNSSVPPGTMLKALKRSWPWRENFKKSSGKLISSKQFRVRWQLPQVWLNNQKRSFWSKGVFNSRIFIYYIFFLSHSLNTLLIFCYKGQSVGIGNKSDHTGVWYHQPFQHSQKSWTFVKTTEKLMTLKV